MTETVNSDRYWDTRFLTNWDAYAGPAQSRFFANIACQNLPSWFIAAVREGGLSVADWGCAQGDGTDVLLNYVGPARVTGIDFSPVAIEQARERYPEIAFKTEDWLIAEAAKETYDIVFSSNTLEHFHEPYVVLDEISWRARKAVVLLLPYRETDRLQEHFHSFYPKDIPQRLPNNFQLVWSIVVDCSRLDDPHWPGEQILLIFAESSWLANLALKLQDVLVEHEPNQAVTIASLMNECEDRMAERDTARALLVEQQGELAEVFALRDAVAERDATIQRMRRSSSWRLTLPLRLLARFLRHGVTGPDRQRLLEMARTSYHRMPLPPMARRQISRVYHRGRGLLRRTADPANAAAPPPTVTTSVLRALPGRPDYIIWGVIDWHFRHQRPQQLAKSLSQQGRRVFYVSVNLVNDSRAGFEAEPLDGSGRLFQIKLFAAGAPTIYIGAPSPDTLNQLRHSLGEVLQWADAGAAVSLVQHPFWSEVAAVVPDSRLVYDCMDHHGGFGHADESILRQERHLIETSELTVTTSAWLDQNIGKAPERRALIRNGADYSHFSTPPATVRHAPGSRRVIGYYGAIAEWFDIELVAGVAKAYPDCEVLLIGADTVQASRRLRGLDNVIFTGEVPYAELPSYLHGFDVAMLPFRILPLTQATNPVKVYEYLSAGKPVVSVDLPEISQFVGLVRVGKDHADFIAAIGEVLAEPTNDQAVQARQSFASGQTWTERGRDLVKRVESNIPDPRISVVIVTYNNLELTRQCLEGLEASHYTNLETVIVDNASSDGTPEFLRTWSQDIPTRRVILNPENRGFAAANNQGLDVATGEYLVLLNNDTYVTPGCLRTLLNHLRHDPGLGLIGPVTNNIGNEAKIEISYGSMPEMLVRSAAYTRRHIGEVRQMRNLAFFCVMMPRATYDLVGALDEIFGRGFFEDDDYCRRVEGAGLRLGCAEDVFVHHHLSASFNKLDPSAREALFGANRKLYEAKWGPWTPHGRRG